MISRSDKDFSAVAQLLNARIHNSSGAPSLTPLLDGRIYFETTVSTPAVKRLMVYDSTISAFFKVPRADYAETIPGQWSFTTAGGSSPFLVTSTTLVANLNANLLNGYDTSVAPAVNKIAVRTGTGTGTLQAADPVADADLVTYHFLKTYVSGTREIKEGCKYATTANLAGTRSGNVITETATNGILTVDGANPSVNDRILLKDQTSGQDNGIYVVTNTGSVSVKWVLTRAADADEDYTTDSEVINGMSTWVTNGTINQNSGWLLTTLDPIIINVTPLVFVQNGGASQIIAGWGLQFSSNQLNLNVSGRFSLPGSLGSQLDLATVSNAGTGSPSASNTLLTLSVDSWGRVNNTTFASIAIAAGQINSGALSSVRGGTGSDLSAAVVGSLLYGSSVGLFSATPALSGLLQGNGAGAPTAITGTAGYIPAWAGSGPYLTGTSNAYNSGTEFVVGGGTTTDGATGTYLSVVKAQAALTAAVISNTNASGQVALIMKSGTAAADTGGLYMDSVSGGSAATSQHFLRLANPNGVILASSSQTIQMYAGGLTSTSYRMLISSTGTSIGLSSSMPTASAYLTLQAGTATAGTAPLKFTSGTNTTTVEPGAMEFDGNAIYTSYLFSAVNYRRAQAMIYSTTIGDGTTKTFTVNHKLASTYVLVRVYDTTTGSGATGDEVDVDVTHTSTSAVTITFLAAGAAPTTGQYAVVVIGATTAGNT